MQGPPRPPSEEPGGETPEFFPAYHEKRYFLQFCGILTLFRRFLSLFAAFRAFLDPGSCILEAYCPIMASEYFTGGEALEKIKVYNHKSSKSFKTPDISPVSGKFLVFAHPPPSILNSQRKNERKGGKPPLFRLGWWFAFPKNQCPLSSVNGEGA